MVYKGNLHKVPDEPRRWTPPTPNIPLKAFKKLLLRRSIALARLRSSPSDVATASIPDPASVLTPDNSRPEPVSKGIDLDKNLTAPELPPPEDSKDVGGSKDEIN